MNGKSSFSGSLHFLRFSESQNCCHEMWNSDFLICFLSHYAAFHFRYTKSVSIIRFHSHVFTIINLVQTQIQHKKSFNYQGRARYSDTLRRIHRAFLDDIYWVYIYTSFNIIYIKYLYITNNFNFP